MGVVDYARSLAEALGIRTKQMQQAYDQTIRQMAIQGAQELRPIARSILSQPGTGKAYPSRRGDGSTHIASAPGRPPAPDTGNYRASIYTQAGPAAPQQGWYVGIGSNEPYAEALEYGHTIVFRNGKSVYVAPRPHMSPALVTWIETRFRPRIRGMLISNQKRLAGGRQIVIEMPSSPNQGVIGRAKMSKARGGRFNPGNWFR